MRRGPFRRVIMHGAEGLEDHIEYAAAVHAIKRALKDPAARALGVHLLESGGMVKAGEFVFQLALPDRPQGGESMKIEITSLQALAVMRAVVLYHKNVPVEEQAIELGERRFGYKPHSQEMTVFATKWSQRLSHGVSSASNHMDVDTLHTYVKLALERYGSQGARFVDGVEAGEVRVFLLIEEGPFGG